MCRARDRITLPTLTSMVARIEAGYAAAAAQSHRRDEYEMMMAARTVSVSEARSAVDKIVMQRLGPLVATVVWNAVLLPGAPQ